jgi:predicted nucleotidyltransferase
LENKYESIIREKLLELFNKTDAVIFLFGSRAKGNFKTGSDFDIGVESFSYAHSGD